MYDSVWLLLLLKGEGMVGAASSLLWGVRTGGVWTRQGFSLLGRVWVVGGMRVRGECEGHWLLKLLSMGLGDGVRCSRSLLRGLPPPTRLYSSLGVDRTDHGSILMVEDGMVVQDQFSLQVLWQQARSLLLLLLWFSWVGLQG